MLDELKKYCEKGEATIPSKGYRGLNIFGKIKFTNILLRSYWQLNKFNQRSFIKKECYIGPFVGEFGNFLLHVLPYLSYLFDNKIKIHYCGLQIHEPFLVDEFGNNIIHEFYPIRDFFSEVKPSGNHLPYYPNDIQSIVDDFFLKAKHSGLPCLDLRDADLYWYVFRNWQLNGKQKIYNLSKYYNPSGERKNQVVIFPRKFNGYTKNNGGPINYSALTSILLKRFEKVIFVGHPEHISIREDEFTRYNNIEFYFENGNRGVLEACSKSRVIVTPHSGAMHVGGYTHTPVLLIFEGSPPIKGLDDSIRFRKNFPFNKVSIEFGVEESILDKV